MSVAELARPTVNARVVRELEEMLEEAKAGGVTAVAMAVLRPGRVTATWWVVEEGDDVDYFRLVGAVSHLQHRMNANAGGCE